MAPRNIKAEDSSEAELSSSSSGRGSGGQQRRRAARDGDDYRLRREKNNQAVRRSRDKSKLKAQQAMEHMACLRKENEMLEAKIEMLNRELGYLKDMFLNRAGLGASGNPTPSSQPPIIAVPPSANHVPSLDNDHIYLAQTSP